MSQRELSQTYYLSMLKFLGCTSESQSAALAFGDEQAMYKWAAPAMGDGPLAFLTAMAKNHGAGSSTPERLRLLATAMLGMPAMQQSSKAHCEVAQRLAARMGFDDELCLQLTQVFEYWNGTGKPNHLKRDQISLPVRVVTVAEDAQIFARLNGPEAAVAMARRRAGNAYDPDMARLFCDKAHSLLDGLVEASSWQSVLAVEPGMQDVLSDADLDMCLAALGDFCDLKSRYFLGHSTAVAELATSAAGYCKLSAPEITCLRRSALVHEIGLAGISSGIVDKDGALTEMERERLRMHAYYTERVLSRPAALAQLGAIASLHHERLDGSGYHKGSTAAMQPFPARILAAACAYRTEISPQPGRPACTPSEAATVLQAEAKDGKLDAEAVQAVLAVAGHSVRLPRQTLPAGLSEREVEVLRLLAQGMSRKEIASELIIADKTVAHHIEHIYNKIGSSTRPAATLFALQNGLMLT